MTARVRPQMEARKAELAKKERDLLIRALPAASFFGFSPEATQVAGSQPDPPPHQIILDVNS